MKKKKILSFLLSASLLAAAVVPASPVTAQGTNPSTGSSAAVDTDGDGLYVGKTATEVGDNQYQITLEAFTDGEVSFEEKSVPADIVLVLDQSGSMAENFTIEGGQYFVKYSTNGFLSVLEMAMGPFNCVKLNANAYEYRDNLYYSPDGENYYQVDLTRSGGLWGAGATYTYTWTDAQGSHSVSGSGMTSLTDNIPAPLYGNLYRTVTEVSKLEALKIAVSSFVDQVAASAAGPDGETGTADDVPYRISIVGFGSGASGYQNTELFIGDTQYRYDRISSSNYQNAFQSVLTEEGMQNIYNSISSLEAEGATHIDLGMDMAEKIIQNNPLDPAEERNRAVVVFTDGTPGDYDTDSTATKNGYANDALISAKNLKSNGTQVFSVGIFDGADDEAPVNTSTSSWTDNRTVNRFMQYLSSNYPNATSMNNGGERASSNYYFSANDAERLNEIFETIGQTISKPTIDLDENTIVKDVVSPYFDVPANKTDIHVYTADYNGTTFDDPESADGVTVNINGDTISVTGFDFNSNFISQSPKQDGSYGKKLIIQFVVTPKEGFLGGNGVPTNGEESGVYIPGMEEAQDYFPQPTVDVPIADINVTAQDKNVYLLNSLSADQLKAGATVKVGNVSLQLGANNFGLEAWQNAFVNINVTAPEDKTNLTVDTDTYDLSVAVTPKTEGTVAGKTGSDSANIYVFKPEITWQDSQINAGEVANYKDNFVSEVWKHNGTESTAVSMIGEKPTLSYGYDPVAAAFTQETPVKVTVKIGDQMINQYTDFLHEDCDFSDCKWDEVYKNQNYHFVVHIKSFDLTIKKTGCEDIDENQTFIFNVTGPNDYSTQVVIQGNGSVTIKNLPAGDYTITEDTSWSWRYEPEGGSEQTVTANDVKNGTATVTFKNTRDNEKWVDGDAYVWNLFDGSNNTK